MSAHPRNTLAVVGVPVAVRSGLLRPVSPAVVARMVRTLYRTGTGAAALAALAAARWPDQPAITDDAGSLTYRELARQADLLAGGLAVTRGVGSGSPVGLLCRNHRGFVLGLLATARLGADLLLLNTDFPGPQLAQVLAGRELRAIICDSEFAERLDEAGYAGPVIIADDPDAESSMDCLVALGVQPASRASRSGSITLLTSGTTGTPKGAPRVPSTKAFLGLGLSAIDRLGLQARGTMLIAPPLFHGMGVAQLVMGLFLGNHIVLHRRFDAETVLASIVNHHVNHLAVVPVMLQRILALPEDVRRRYETTALRSVLSGAAPLSPALATEFQDTFGEILFNGYGSSEVGVATLATPPDLRAAPGTVGGPVLHTTVRILDDDSNAVPQGTTGHIFVESPMTFGGYSEGGNKRLEGAAMSTGDRGFLDAQGRLTVAGREDDMIVSGGENVYPQEVEDVLATHHAVADVAVIGVDDPEFGQRLKAFVVLRSGHAAEPADLTDYVKRQVARYKVPREVVVIDELPRNPTGKVLKRALPA